MDSSALNFVPSRRPSLPEYSETRHDLDARNCIFNRYFRGEAILRSLKANGVDYLFINPGSDFAPIIEALAGAPSDDIPEPVTSAHENVVVTMAHGYYLATGKMQAAAVHVNVGLANAVMGMLNAHSDNVPIFMMSGRNPLTEDAAVLAAARHRYSTATKCSTKPPWFAKL